jgi:DMSO/TMAO reductase YedYZ heme-binding membrane subunit
VASTRSRSGGREHARPNTGGVTAEYATKIYPVAGVGIVVIIAFLALTSVGHVIDAATQHFMLFYAGVFALIGLCASVGLGLVATDRRFLSPGHRVLIQSAHRAASFGAVTFLIVHIITEILAQRVHVIDAVIPFLSPFRTFYIGLGTIASDLIILLVVTGILRGRFNASGRAWRWRAMHYTSYAAFVFGVWHGLLGGRPGKPYVDWSYGFVVAFVLLGLAVRVLSNSLKPKESLSGPPVPTSAPSASAPLRAAAMAAQLSVSRGGRGGLGVSGGQPVLSTPLGAPVLTATALPAGGQTAPGQPYYEPGYEGPPRYLGAPRGAGSGPLPRADTGPLPRAATGPQPLPPHPSGPLPRVPTGPMPRMNTGPMPVADTGPLPPYASGPMPRVNSGPLPRAATGPMPRTGTGSLPHYETGPVPQYGTGPIPRADTGPIARNATGPIPRAGTGPIPRNPTGPMPRANTGPIPHHATGPMPRAGTGPIPRNATGPMPQYGTGPIPRNATGPMPRAGTGPVPRNATGPVPRNATGPMPQYGTGPMPRAATGPIGRGDIGPQPPRPGTGPQPRGATGPQPQAGNSRQRGWDGGPPPQTAAGPVRWPDEGQDPRAWTRPMPADGGPRSRPAPPAGGGYPPAFPAHGYPALGYPDAAGGSRPDRPSWPEESHDGGWYPGEPPWASDFTETDPDFRYREPGPGMPGYRGARDNRYGGDRR